MQSNRAFQICTRCILSTIDDPAIYFDESGVCNHCHLYDKVVSERISLPDELEKNLTQLVTEIKRRGAGKKYDCIIGVSGGVDSTYVAFLVKELGLRPLAVHCDNGWNSELAVSNISNILLKLGIDLYTHVINWDEFRDLQLAYLKASVIDIEATSDHAIFATLYKTANKFNIKYILSGENLATEGILPEQWIHNKNDLVNIKAIFRKFGNGKIKTFPTLGFLKKEYYERIQGIQYIRILDHVNYNKKEAKKIISEKLSWRDYEGKHYESIITRFFQSYILPVKFHVDKRRSHLSTMICSGQLSREDALIEISKSPIDEKKLEEDKVYVLKKFGLTESEFDKIIALPQVAHTSYPSILNLFKKIRPLTRIVKKIFLEEKFISTKDIKKSKRVAMLLDNPLINDNRVKREAYAIAKHFDLTLFCMKHPDLPFREIVNEVKIERVIPRDIFKIQSYKKLRSIAQHIASGNFDIIHCHDHLMLNLGAMVKKINPQTILIYDSHELFHSWPLNFSGKSFSIILKSFIVRRIQIFREKKLGTKGIDYLITVNQSLADVLKKYFKLKTNALVIRNVPDHDVMEERKNILRKKFSIPEHQKILVFIGEHIYLKTLNMKQVLDEIGNKPDLAFVIISSPDEHRREIEEYAKSKKYSNIFYNDVIAYKEITNYLSGCDAGLIPTWNKRDLSYWYALDNKLFSYLMAEIPMLSTAQPEYKAIVEKYELGVCINPDDPGAYYSGWQKLIQNKNQYLQNFEEAKKELNWENESKILIDFYDGIVQRKSTNIIQSSFVFPRIAMLLDNAFTMDSRVYREALTLVHAGYPLTIYAVKRDDLPIHDVLDGIVIKRVFEKSVSDFKNYGMRIRSAEIISREQFDILHCHDQLMLFIGSKVKEKRPEIKLIYDSHELFHSWPINYGNHASAWVRLKTDVVRKMEVLREKKSAATIDRLITVSKSLGNDLSKYLQLKNVPVIVRNMAEYEEATIGKTFLREELGIEKETRMVLNFSLNIYWRSRNIEAAIREFANKPGVALVFICDEGGNKKEIMQWVNDAGYKNIYFHKAIQPNEIVAVLCQADYGLLSTWNKQFMSYWLGLENKLFHYVMAELPILASAQPEHREIIEQYKIGVCVNADEPNAYYNGFLELEKNKEAYKRNVTDARRILNWENEQHKLLELYSELKQEIYDRH